MTNAMKKVDIALFAAALQHLEGVFSIYDQDFNLIFANATAYKILPVFFAALENGASQYDATHAQLTALNPDDSENDLKYKTNYFLERLRSGASYEFVSKDNRNFHVSHEKLDTSHILGRGTDITDLKRQKSEMEVLADNNFKLANTDQLTGLANRRHFMETLSEMIAPVDKDEKASKSFWVGLLDLNGFKHINDVYGHATGDQLLCTLATRATDVIGNSTIMARLGGDEFAFIIDEPMSHQQIYAFSQKLCSKISEPQDISASNIQVHSSLGWAHFPTDGETPSDLLRKADYALYKSKQSKTGQAVIFSGLDETHIRRQSEISLQLKNGNLSSELSLKFQPIHDAQAGTVVGFEALARWDNPLLGSISPDEFIPLAEKIGCISDVTKILFEKALEIAEHWPENIDLHFNLSALDLGKVEVIKDLIQLTKASSFPAESIIFEVTETAIIETFERMSKIFVLLERNNLRLALDDFGKGFSSLNYLTRIPVSCLKIDKSFTDRLTPDSKEEVIIRAIKYLCHYLNINCIIEGVEHERQLQQLRSLSFTNMQGYYFSEALGSDEMAAYILNQFVRPKARASDNIAPQTLAGQRVVGENSNNLDPTQSLAHPAR